MYEGIKDKPITNCPHCGSKNIRKAGILPSGYQRYHCRDCNKKISVLTTYKYYRQADTQCPHCKSFHTRKGGTLRDGTTRHICRDCGKSFSSKTVIKEEVKEKCPYCKSADNIIRNGYREGKQKFFCKNCKRSFVPGSQKGDILHNKIVRAYTKGAPVWALSEFFNMTERTIRSHTKRCNKEKHLNRILPTIAQCTKRDVIYYRLGANVSFSDITQYLKVDKEVAERIIEDYLKSVGEVK